MIPNNPPTDGEGKDDMASREKPTTSAATEKEPLPLSAEKPWGEDHLADCVDLDDCAECGGEGGYNSCMEDSCAAIGGEEDCDDPGCWVRCSSCGGSGRS